MEINRWLDSRRAEEKEYREEGNPRCSQTVRSQYGEKRLESVDEKTKEKRSAEESTREENQVEKEDGEEDEEEKPVSRES